MNWWLLCQTAKLASHWPPTPGDRLGTATNNSGGVQGGISNGEPIVMRLAFKPPATIAKGQQTCTMAGEEEV